MASDDFEKAKASGVAMNNSLGKIDMNLFKADAHSQWMQQSTALKAALQHIEHLGDIKALRDSFMGISNAMITIAETFNPIPYPTYVQHCPMADSNKGADWLSNGKEILNPYFGEAMLSCGETTKTLK